MADAALWAADAGVLLASAAAGLWVGLWALPGPVRARLRALRRGRSSASERWTPPARPLEEVVVHVRRLGRLHHSPPQGRSRARAEGIRRAYDDALAECCGELGIVHLLHVLPPGPDLDAERSRVERRLELSGVELDLTG